MSVGEGRSAHDHDRRARSTVRRGRTSGRSNGVPRATIGVLVLLVGAAVLAACGPSSPPNGAVPSSGADKSIDGPRVDRLPTVPRPTVRPGTPDLSTVAGQRTFLQNVFNDVQTMWENDLTAAGVPYVPAHLVLFEAQASTACGTESANVGPFYCAGDRTVYLDIRFFTAMEAQFGLKGDFAEAYVVAHEFGHHIQSLLGITARVAAAARSDPPQANALSVREELQADCFAGVWAHSTYVRTLLEPGDIGEALHAAQVVGDDFLAHASGATAVDPDSWTHGSSAQRQRWFTTGYEVGRPDACNTFTL